MSGGRSCVIQGEAEGAVDERAEQLLPGGEVAVDRPDSHARVLGDLGHWDLLSVAPDEFDGRFEHPLAITERVLAGLAGGGS